ncbi:hypothetical protein [Streptomyces sp. NPDC059909]|uniref:hypothetical protein n=1 Tax=Streptomyces sp. NPDC059909 TaxID=3346998 RepID=UPI00364EBABA
MFRWTGNDEAAATIAGFLTANAVAHAGPGLLHDRRCLGLRLAITEKAELLGDVSDPLPEFKDFDRAVAGERGRDLWRVGLLGGELSWFLVKSGGKTVRARLAPEPV